MSKNIVTGESQSDEPFADIPLVKAKLRVLQLVRENNQLQQRCDDAIIRSAELETRVGALMQRCERLAKFAHDAPAIAYYWVFGVDDNKIEDLPDKLQAEADAAIAAEQEARQ